MSPVDVIMVILNWSHLSSQKDDDQSEEYPVSRGAPRLHVKSVVEAALGCERYVIAHAFSTSTTAVSPFPGLL